MNDHIQDVTRRCAAAGYHAVAPALFHRAGGGTAPYDDFAQVMPLFAGVTDDGVLADVDATIAHLEGAGFAPARIGIVGFCFGGRVTFLVAARRAARRRGRVLRRWHRRGRRSAVPAVDRGVGDAADAVARAVRRSRRRYLDRERRGVARPRSGPRRSTPRSCATPTPNMASTATPARATTPSRRPTVGAGRSSGSPRISPERPRSTRKPLPSLGPAGVAPGEPVRQNRDRVTTRRQPSMHDRTSRPTTIAEPTRSGRRVGPGVGSAGHRGRSRRWSSGSVPPRSSSTWARRGGVSPSGTSGACRCRRRCPSARCSWCLIGPRHLGFSRRSLRAWREFLLLGGPLALVWCISYPQSVAAWRDVEGVVVAVAGEELVYRFAAVVLIGARVRQGRRAQLA